MPERLRHSKSSNQRASISLGPQLDRRRTLQQFFAQKMKKFREVWASIQSWTTCKHKRCIQILRLVLQGRAPVPHGAPSLTAELGEFDKEFRESMESITGQTSDFTWAFMGLGCKMGGLGLRPSKLHALGGYLASFSGASR